MRCPFFSIVIPTYCSEAYIGNAILSILKQKFRDWEIIVIDDGSTDNTIEIVEKFATTDSRIRLVALPHRGTQLSRYTGMRNAFGRYIMFLDSDDVFENDTLTIVYDTLTMHPADLLIFGMKMVYEDGTVVSQNKEFKEGYIDKTELFERLIKERIVKSMGRKVISNVLVHPFDSYISSNIMTYGEDMFQSLQILARVESVYYMNSMLYTYQIRRNSTMTTFYANKYKDRLVMYAGIMHYGTIMRIEENRLRDLSGYYLLTHVVDCIDEIRESELTNQEKEKKYKEIFQSAEVIAIIDLKHRLNLSQRQISVLSRYKDKYEQ